MTWISNNFIDSSYAFAAINSIRSRLAIKYGPHSHNLSEKEVIECTNGCHSGNAAVVYNYTQKYGGCTEEVDKVLPSNVETTEGKY